MQEKESIISVRAEPRDAKPLGQICPSVSYTHVRFLYSNRIGIIRQLHVNTKTLAADIDPNNKLNCGQHRFISARIPGIIALCIQNHSMSSPTN